MWRHVSGSIPCAAPSDSGSSGTKKSIHWIPIVLVAVALVAPALAKLCVCWLGYRLQRQALLMCFPTKYVCTRYAQPCCKQLWKRHCQLPASILDCFYSGVWNKAAAKVLQQQVCIASRNLWIKLAPQTRRSRTAIISRLSLVFVTYDLVQDFPTMAQVTSSKSLGPRQSAEGGPSQVAHRSKVGTWYWSHLVTFMDAMRKGILYHLILLRQT